MENSISSQKAIDIRIYTYLSSQLSAQNVNIDRKRIQTIRELLVKDPLMLSGNMLEILENQFISEGFL